MPVYFPLALLHVSTGFTVDVGGVVHTVVIVVVAVGVMQHGAQHHPD